MIKVTAAFDGLNFAASTMEHAIKICKNTNGFVSGVFLDDFVYHSYRLADVINSKGAISDDLVEQHNAKDEQCRLAAMDTFRKGCEDAGILYSIRRDRGVALQDLLRESVFSNLVVLEKEIDFNIFKDVVPSLFLKDFLSDIMSPVLIVPKKFKPITKYLLLYNGKPAAIHSLKMFNYVIPFEKGASLDVLTIKSSSDEQELQDNLFEELTSCYQLKIQQLTLCGELEDTLSKYLKNEKEEVLIILGSYQRGRVSMWFKHSLADHLLRNFDFPIFMSPR